MSTTLISSLDRRDHCQHTAINPQFGHRREAKESKQGVFEQAVCVCARLRSDDNSRIINIIDRGRERTQGERDGAGNTPDAIEQGNVDASLFDRAESAIGRLKERPISSPLSSIADRTVIVPL